MLRSSWFWLLALVLLASCGTGDGPAPYPDSDLTAAAAADRYIVVMHGAPAPDRAAANQARAADVARAHGLSANRTYGAAIVGFAAHVPADRVAALERDPRVAYVERDDPVTLFAQTIPTGVQRIFADDNANLDIDGTDDQRVDVDVAVIDTGVDFEHPDLNVVGGVDCTVASGGGPPWSRTYTCSSTEGTGGDDDHYHGTHVAGTIAALDDGEGVVGVAPGARLWAVKVLDSSGSGYESGIMAGIDWIVAQGTIEVANMSLGGSGFSQGEYDAIQGAVDSGVAFAVAAGNSDDDASGYSPAAFDNVLTVSALADFDGEPGGNGSPSCRSDQDDTLADFSNWGDAVQIAAPGVCILSTYPLEQGESGTISGTSMASPHVAGALALLASANPPANAEGVGKLYVEVVEAGNHDWTDDSGDGAQEPLLDVSDTGVFVPALETTGDGGEVANASPTVAIVSPPDGATFESGATISFEGTASDHEDGDLTGDLVWNSDLDGQLGTGSSVSVVLSGGTHAVEATVSDSAGQDASDTITVTVEHESVAGISLDVSAYKVRGAQHADLAWTGATSTDVDVVRNGGTVGTTSNDGAYTDTTGAKGGGSAWYQVCEHGTSTCSPVVEVSW